MMCIPPSELSLTKRLHAVAAITKWPWLAHHAWLRKIVISILGTILIVGGMLMMALPGPGIVTLLLGLSVMAAEFAWAKRSLAVAEQWVERLRAAWCKRQ